VVRVCISRNLEANLYVRRSSESLLSGSDPDAGLPPATRTTRRAAKDNFPSAPSAPSAKGSSVKRSRLNQRDIVSVPVKKGAVTPAVKFSEATTTHDDGEELKEPAKTLDHHTGSDAFHDHEDRKEHDDNKSITKDEPLSPGGKHKTLQGTETTNSRPADGITDLEVSDTILAVSEKMKQSKSSKSIESSKKAHKTTTRANSPISSASESYDEPEIETASVARDKSPDNQTFHSRRKGAKVAKHPTPHVDNQITATAGTKKKAPDGGVKSTEGAVASAAEGDIAVGSAVEVAARVGPGSNRPGGVAILVDYCADSNTYAVK